MEIKLHSLDDSVGVRATDAVGVIVAIEVSTISSVEGPQLAINTLNRMAGVITNLPKGLDLISPPCSDVPLET
jgi:hypothetical protein